MRTDPKNPNKVGRVIIPLVVPNTTSEDAFTGSAFKTVWDVVRALKTHDFRLEAALNRLRGLTALGPISEQDFTEATHLRIIGLDDLAAFQLRVIEQSSSNFWWWVNGPLKQYVTREGHANVNATHKETIDGIEYNLGVWVSNRRSEFRKGMLAPERVVELEAIKGWTWDPIEDAYQQWLAALKQYVTREGHANVPGTHKETIDGIEYNLGTWVSTRRKEFRKNKLAPERVVELEAIKGWGWSSR